MTEREMLLRAVCESPDDDTPRLVFADWLDENGEPERAEFIRVQIEQTKLEPHTVPWWKCYSRARKLFAVHGRTWHIQIVANDEFTWDEFVRGFAEGVTAPSFAALKDFAKPLFSRTPLVHLRIVQRVRLSDLCAVPRVLRLGILTVSAGLTTVDEARTFLDTAGENGPTILAFEDRIASPDVERLLTERFGGRLIIPDD
jgi:uncharacterized protein (TIGR02996 family)